MILICECCNKSYEEHDPDFIVKNEKGFCLECFHDILKHMKIYKLEFIE